jgi:hypothetical protein
VLHEYDRIETRDNTQVFDTGDTCGENVARALFLGAQAGVHAYGQYPGWYEKMFQYGRVPGVATDMILSNQKCVFDSEDFGVITVDTVIVPD